MFVNISDFGKLFTVNQVRQNTNMFKLFNLLKSRL